MASANRWREVCAGAIFLAAFAFGGEPGHAALMVVGDDACALHAIDVESFATCEEGSVVRTVEASPEPATLRVTADEACELFAVDIAAFATCEDGRVVRLDARTAIAAR